MRSTAALGFLHQRHGIRVNCVVPDRGVPQEDFVSAVVELSQREACAGRVALCRTGRPLELVAHADPGYQALEPF